LTATTDGGSRLPTRYVQIEIDFLKCYFRMLRRAEAVINLLENPAARPNEQATSEEQQEEEVTPIIEARVIVPPGNNETIDEAMVLSAVQNTLFDAASGSM
jgi:hypothetical protein